MAISLAHGLDECFELIAVETTIRTHTGAQVHAERTHPFDRLADIVW